jgi:hypothetical protein
VCGALYQSNGPCVCVWSCVSIKRAMCVCVELCINKTGHVCVCGSIKRAVCVCVCVDQSNGPCVRGCVLVSVRGVVNVFSAYNERVVRINRIVTLTTLVNLL